MRAGIRGVARGLIERLSYANVMSTLGVFIALGGTSYAVAKLPRNSVGSAHIKNNAVTGSKVRDGSLGRSDLSRTARLSGPRGTRGSEGPPGPLGPQGPPGAAEGYIARNNAGNQIPTAGTVTISELRLPAGAYAVDFSAHTYWNGPPTFVDCQLIANGQQFVKTAVKVGNESAATIEAVISMADATTFPETTVVRVLCSERVDTGVVLTDARLRAIRLTTVVG